MTTKLPFSRLVMESSKSYMIMLCLMFANAGPWQNFATILGVIERIGKPD